MLKPADDKFIDKLLKEESGGEEEEGRLADDKALIDMLAMEKPSKAAERQEGQARTASTICSTRGREGSADARDQGPEETPEWAKPEIRESAPAPAPIAAAKPAKHDDGIIRVVQGAAGSLLRQREAGRATTTHDAQPAPAARNRARASRRPP